MTAQLALGLYRRDRSERRGEVAIESISDFTEFNELLNEINLHHQVGVEILAACPTLGETTTRCAEPSWVRRAKTFKQATCYRT